MSHSNSFSDWSAIGSPTLTSNYGVSPDGTQNSTRVQMVSGDRIYTSITSPSEGSFSVYLKGSGVVKLRDSANIVFAVVTLTSEWVRYYNIGDFSSSSNIQIQYVSGSVDLEIYGAQFEEGSYATSYIPTYGSPYTRLGEVVKDAGDVNTFNSTEGVLFAEISALANDLTNRYISINDGTTGNSIRFYYSTTSQTFRARYYVGGAAQCSLVYVATDLTQSAKIAFKWKVNDFALWVDGVEVHTDDSGTVNPTNTFDRLDFKFINIESFYGKTSQIQVFNTALSDAELADLTTPITYDSFNEMANALNLTII